jgi:putative nucleotidyltransferase with HDIG domain
MNSGKPPELRRSGRGGNASPVGTSEALIRCAEAVDNSEISSVRPVIVAVLRLINDPAATPKDLKKLISLDLALTARILRVANSAYFGCPRTVTEIDQAIIWIGFDAIKEIALNQSLITLFERQTTAQEVSHRELWKHGVAVAMIAKRIFRREFGQPGNEAYAAGLLHDLGIVLLEQLDHDRFLRTITEMEDAQINFADAEDRLFEFNHTQLAHAVLTRWQLPNEMCDAIGSHHDPVASLNQGGRLAGVLALADHLAQGKSLGFADAPHNSAEFVAEISGNLGLEPHSLQIIVGDVVSEISRRQARGLV